MTVC